MKNLLSLAALAVLVALNTSCKKEKMEEEVNGGNGNTTTIDSRLPGTWESIAYESSGIPGCGQQKETRTYSFQSSGQYAYDFVSELLAPCSGTSSSSQAGSIATATPSDTEKTTWADAFPNDNVALDLKITFTYSSGSSTYFFQFLDSNSKFRLFWESNGDKYWREYEKQ